MFLKRRNTKNFFTSEGREYLSRMVIFIESAVLSTVSKIVQFALISNITSDDPFFVPLCVSLVMLEFSYTGLIKLDYCNTPNHPTQSFRYRYHEFLSCSTG